MIHIFVLICKILVTISAFEVIWNVPTDRCNASVTKFPDLLRKANITLNNGGKFSGEKIRILYSPGNWSSLEHKKMVNNGLPYKGNFTLHLKRFKDAIQKLDANFTGYAVIDMESFRPVFRQNTGWMLVYRNRTLNDTAELFPNVNNDKNALFKKAEHIFEPPAEAYMLESIRTAIRLRKDAKWGYYGYPYCFNYEQSNFTCPEIVKKENNRTDWLFSAYNYMFPSVYIFKRYSDEQNRKLVMERIKEFKRIKKISRNKQLKFYPYVWFYYNDPGNQSTFLTKKDFNMTLSGLKKKGMDGCIIWGSSKDYEDPKFCTKFLNYTKTIIIPTVKGLK